jgi:hypothetical protein
MYFIVWNCQAERGELTTMLSKGKRAARKLKRAQTAIEAIVDGCVGTILGWAIAPASAALEDIDDATDDAPIVISFRSGQVHRQMRCNACPLPVN